MNLPVYASNESFGSAALRSCVCLSFPSATLGFGRLVRPFQLVSFVPNSGAFPPDQRDFHPQYHSTSPLRTLSPIFLSKIFAKMTDFYPYYSALATIWGVRRRAELQYRKIHGNGGHPLCVCRILEPEIRGQFRFWFRLRRTQERRPATSRAH